MDDDEISVYSSFQTEDFNPNFNLNYLEEVIQKASDELNTITKTPIIESYTGLLSVEFFYGNWQNYKSYELITFDLNSSKSIPSNLIAGRMPVKGSEILYYQNEDATHIVNETITLQGNDNYLGEARNFTVVGIISGIEDTFYNVGHSFDVFTWEESLVDENSPKFHEKFFTLPNLFFEALNNYTSINSFMTTLVDFDYYLTNLDVREFPKFVKDFQNLFEKGVLFHFDYIESTFSIASDLYIAISDFEVFWLNETITLIALSLPIILLLLFLEGEITSFNKLGLKKTISLMQMQGIDKNSIRNILLIENLSISSINFFSGILFGTIFGYIITLVLQWDSNFMFYLSGLKQVSLLILPILVVFFLISYLSKLSILRNTNINKSEITITKRKTGIKKILTKEFIPLIPGIIFLATSLIFQFILSNQNLLNNLNENIFFTLFTNLAWILLYIGILLTAFSIFHLLSEILLHFWSLIGEVFWKKNKSYFGLLMKNISVDRKKFRNVVFVFLFIGLGLIPGILTFSTLEKHSVLEEDLAVGCSDLVITNWSNEYSDWQIINNIDGINSSTEVCQINYFRDFRDYSGNQLTYSINVLTLKNCSEFIATINFGNLGEVSYSLDDISSLDTKMNYLMNSYYAKTNGYDKDEILYNTGIMQFSANNAMTYINSFEYFPSLPIESRNIFKLNYISYSLVTSSETIMEIENSIAEDTEINQIWILLIKVNNGIDIDSLKDEIHNKTGFTAVSKLETNELENYSFISTFLMLNSIITVLILIFISFITSRTIYQEKLYIIESNYRLGITRNQITTMFTLEFLILTITSIIVSFFIGMLLLKFLSKTFLNIKQVYAQYIVNPSFWLSLLIISLTLIICICGWLSNIIPQMRKYRPLKQE